MNQRKNNDLKKNIHDERGTKNKMENNFKNNNNSARKHLLEKKILTRSRTYSLYG